VLRRLQIQADNVGCLAFEIGIVAGQVTLQAVGFEAGFLPHPIRRVFAYSQSRRQPATTPVGGTVAGFLAGGRKNFGPQSRSQNAGPLTAMVGVQPIHPEFEKALLPTNHGGSTGLRLALDRVERGSFGQHQDELGAKHVTCRQGTRLRNAAELGTLVIGERGFAIGRYTNLEA